MLTVNFSSRFKRAYKKLPKEVRSNFDQKIIIFMSNPYHPSLRTHNLHGKLQSCFSFSLNDGFRVLFEFENAREVNLLDIGPHDRYQRWKR